MRTHSAGTKRINHPEVGELTEAYETMMIPGSPGVGMTTYLPAPGSASADALTMLQHCVVDVVDSPAAVAGTVAHS